MILDIRITVEETERGYEHITAQNMDTGEKVDYTWEPDIPLSLPDAVELCCGALTESFLKRR